MLHDTYDLSSCVQDAEMHVLADWFAVPKESPSELFIDHDHYWRGLIVGLSQKTSALQRDFHDFQISWLDYVEKGAFHFRLRSRLAFSFQPEGQLGITPHRRGPGG